MNGIELQPDKMMRSLTQQLIKEKIDFSSSFEFFT